MAEHETRDDSGASAASGDARPRGDYCVFTRGEGAFALSTHIAREVLDWRPFTPVPRGPAELLGAFNLRGEVVPLVCLDRFLGTPPRALERSDTFLVLGERDLVLAAVVDRVVAIRHIAPWEIQRSDPAARAHNPLVRGSVHREGQSALLLDGERLLAEIAANVAGGFRHRPAVGLQGRPSREAPGTTGAAAADPPPGPAAEGR